MVSPCHFFPGFYIQNLPGRDAERIILNISQIPHKSAQNSHDSKTTLGNITRKLGISVSPKTKGG